MSLKVKWLDIRHLKRLSEEIQNIASSELKNTLADYISSTKNGEYLCNIFSDAEIRELEDISSRCLIWSLL